MIKKDFDKIEKQLNKQISELCLNAIAAYDQLHGDDETIDYYESDIKITLNYLGMKLKAERDFMDHGGMAKSYGAWRYYVNGNEVTYWKYDIKTGKIEIINLPLDRYFKVKE